ncbi:MAG: glycerol kinase GlpK [Spirochaetaceae bacterium]|nr:glycerol kinase GlpK [Spirochaetaceae bacterium]
MHILAVDQSTASTKGLVFDEQGTVVARAARAHRQHHPRPDWAEHDAEEIYRNVLAVIGELVQGEMDARSFAGLAITNQRETVVVWDRDSGHPVHPAIVWQCMRGAEACRELRAAGLEELFRQRTGLLLDPFFSASKIRWVLEHVPGARRKAEAGELLAGTIDSWLVWKLTGGSVHVTDLSNASRTLLLDIRRRRWEPELCAHFGIPVAMLPEPVSSSGLVGETTADGVLPAPVPIAAIAGDSHAALFGQRCFAPGDVKVTVGTGSSIMMNVGGQVRDSGAGLVSSIGFGLEDRVDYVLEGNVHSAGDTVQWLIDGLELFDGIDTIERLAGSVAGSGGVYLVPAFSGLGAPWWDNGATAVLAGMSRETTRAHVARAAEESIAFQVRDVLEAACAVVSTPLSDLQPRFDGGGSESDFLMQTVADLIGAPLLAAPHQDMSALGAALLAGLATGVWQETGRIEALPFARRRFEPALAAGEREQRYADWLQAVQRARLRPA